LCEDDEDGANEDEGNDDDDDENEEKVNLLEGFNATMPAARARKLARRKRRAILSERQLGITAGVNELGLKERGDRARGLLGDIDVAGGGQYVVDSIESTPKKRIVKSKRRTSFMPIPLQRPSASTSTSASTEELRAGSEDANNTAPMEELLTKPELEQDLKEIKQDKKALLIRRKLTLKDLNDLEDKMKKLELLKDELGRRLLELKEEELELDDECEFISLFSFSQSNKMLVTF
jgi:division protein 1